MEVEAADLEDKLKLHFFYMALKGKNTHSKYAMM